MKQASLKYGKFKAALRGRLLGSSCGWCSYEWTRYHVGALISEPLNAGLHVGLGFHGYSPFLVDLVVSPQFPSAV